MKCPKCHYLSFDPEPRCRNCGFTLSLDDPELDIALPARVDSPLADFSLRDPETGPNHDTLWDEPLVPPTPPASPRRTVTPPSDAPRRSRASAPGPFDAFAIADVPDTTDEVARISAPVVKRDIDDLVGTTPVTPPVPPTPERTARQAAPGTAELPLFMKGTGTPAALGRPPASVPATPVLPAARVMPAAPVRPASPAHPSQPTPAPRPPVPVRRTTPDAPVRQRNPEPRKIGPLDRDLLDDLERIERADQRDAAALRREHLDDSAGPLKRLTAAILDAALLAALSAGIVWTTLRWCDLSWSQVSMLPVAPVAALLLMMVLGYLFMFTAAGGQTLGKMLAGIRVVDAGVSGDGGEPLSMRQAMYREILSIPSVLLIGAGFVPALFGDERGVHDRIAATRVVRT